MRTLVASLAVTLLASAPAWAEDKPAKGKSGKPADETIDQIMEKANAAPPDDAPPAEVKTDPKADPKAGEKKPGDKAKPAGDKVAAAAESAKPDEPPPPPPTV